ncbi:MAG: DUF4190 domain-containing protein [Oscillospiraceae bacterium]|nr:DUF4190 domain-containing protein [Oscillospiraceae bacterium]
MENNTSSKGMSIGALVCGILGIVGSFIPVVCYFTLVLAILGIVFGAKGMKTSKETGEGRGLAIAGLVLGIIGTSFAAIGVICVACAAGILASAGAL